MFQPTERQIAEPGVLNLSLSGKPGVSRTLIDADVMAPLQWDGQHHNGLNGDRAGRLLWEEQVYRVLEARGVENAREIGLTSFFYARYTIDGAVAEIMSWDSGSES